MRGYHPGLEVEPFASQQVADAGDIACTPFDIDEAIVQIEAGARELLGSSGAFIALGGDHTIALPLLRAVHAGHGPVALVHFDAHLDTWDTYFGAAYTHGTPFRRAHEEGLLAPDQCAHVGIRGPLFSPRDLVDDAGFGFTIVGAFDYLTRSVASVADELRCSRRRHAGLCVHRHRRARSRPRAGTGTPEAGGMTSRGAAPRPYARLLGSTSSAPTWWRWRPRTTTPRSPRSRRANVVYELLGIVRAAMTTLRTLASKVRAREIGAHKLVARLFRRIETFDADLGAVVALRSEALAEARLLDEQLAAGAQAGPLAGLPLLVKDMTDVAGLRTTFGSRAFASAPAATTDAVVVARLRAAGAIVVGKTNLPEFAAEGFTSNDLLAPRRNPWNLERTCGGSSGGSAVALVTGWRRSRRRPTVAAAYASRPRIAGWWGSSPRTA